MPPRASLYSNDDLIALSRPIPLELEDEEFLGQEVRRAGYRANSFGEDYRSLIGLRGARAYFQDSEGDQLNERGWRIENWEFEGERAPRARHSLPIPENIQASSYPQYSDPLPNYDPHLFLTKYRSESPDRHTKIRFAPNTKLASPPNGAAGDTTPTRGSSPSIRFAPLPHELQEDDDFEDDHDSVPISDKYDSDPAPFSESTPPIPLPPEKAGRPMLLLKPPRERDKPSTPVVTSANTTIALAPSSRRWFRPSDAGCSLYAIGVSVRLKRTASDGSIRVVEGSAKLLAVSTEETKNEKWWRRR